VLDNDSIEDESTRMSATLDFPGRFDRLPLAALENADLGVGKRRDIGALRDRLERGRALLFCGIEGFRLTV
jgi:hypothetical protein